MEVSEATTIWLDVMEELKLTLPTLGEKKDFEVYSCDVSPDGSRLVTAAGGELDEPYIPHFDIRSR